MNYLDGIFLLLLSSVTTACAQPPAGRLVAFGDSISAGAFTDNSYPKLLATHFKRELQNHSISSTTLDSDAQIGAIRAQVFLPGDEILFSPGINDALQHQADAAYLAKYEQLLTEALGIFEASGGTAYVGEPLHVLREGNSEQNTAELSGLDKNSEEYAVILRNLLEKGCYRHVYLVQARENFTPIAEAMHDPVHPNLAGHMRLFDLFREAMGG